MASMWQSIICKEDRLMDRKMILSKNLRRLRKEAGLNQKKFAEKMGVSQSNLSKWERSITSPDYNNLCSVADKLKVTADYLLRNNEEYLSIENKFQMLEAFMKTDYKIEIGSFYGRFEKKYYARILDIPEIVAYKYTKEQALIALDGVKREWGYKAIENGIEIPPPAEKGRIDCLIM